MRESQRLQKLVIILKQKTIGEGVCVFTLKQMELSQPPSEKIKQELLSWKGVTIHEHNFVTVMFYVDGIEMGHLHGDSIADLQFPAKVSKKLVKERRVSPHHLITKSGWVSYEIRNAKDVEAVVELFRLQYNRLTKSK